MSKIGYLSPEIKSDIYEKFAGKLWCFVPRLGRPAGLGVAVANEAGCCPVPSLYATYDRFVDAEESARILNAERGISTVEEAHIQASSIAAGKV